MNGQRRPVLLGVAFVLATACAALAGFGGAMVWVLLLGLIDDATPAEVAFMLGTALAVTSLAIVGAYGCYRLMLRARGDRTDRPGFDVLPPR